MSPVVSTLFDGPKAGETNRIDGKEAGVVTVGVGVAVGVAVTVGVAVGVGVTAPPIVDAGDFVISKVNRSVICCMSVKPSIISFMFP